MDFSNIAVLCIGDVMLDRFVHGEIERISPEAPIPIFRNSKATEMLGGAGNVVNNVAALGGKALLVGLVGDDAPADTVGRLVRQNVNLLATLVPSAYRPTICKTRFIAGQQQVVRVDDESRLMLQADEEAMLVDAIDARMSEAAVVVLSDYGKGVLSDAILRHSIATATARGVPIFVDPKSRDFSRYAGATCITPNLKELALATGLQVDDTAAVTAAARQAMSVAGARAVLATRSEKGMLLVEQSGRVTSVAARKREVFDVSGAGDTVIATMALAHASGLSFEQSMHVANSAAGVVVGKLGTATASIQEVLHELGDGGDLTTALPGLRPAADAARQVARWRSQGLRIGLTNGCFDLLHPGHVMLLKAARAECDRLIVALNTDRSVRRLKGPTRPVNDLTMRAQVIAAIRYVDLVTSFDEDTPLRLIQDLVPDVLIKGADYALEAVVGADVVQKAGGKVVLVDLVVGQSTTKILNGISMAPSVSAPMIAHQDLSTHPAAVASNK